MSVPSVQADLLTLLEATFTGPPTLVRFGRPADLPEYFELIYVSTPQNYRLGGGEQFRDEVFDARVVIEVFKTGDEPKATSDRAWALKESVDAALLTDDFHGYSSVGVALAVATTLEGFSNGWHATATLSLAIEDHV